MKLIVEDNFEDVQTIEEGEGKAKKLYVEGVFLQSGIKNRNGRMYPPQMLESEVRRYVTEKVNKNTAYGELEHPATPAISLKNVSHRIVELKQDGNNWIGKAIISTEGSGKIVRGLIEMGSNLGVSSRGTGTLKSIQGINEVQNDFRLATAADIVTDPSAPDAFVNGVMESVDWVWQEGLGWAARQVVESVKAAGDKGGSKALTEELKLQSFRKFFEAVGRLDFSPLCEARFEYKVGDKVIHKPSGQRGVIIKRTGRAGDSPNYHFKRELFPAVSHKGAVLKKT